MKCATLNPKKNNRDEKISKSKWKIKLRFIRSICRRLRVPTKRLLLFLFLLSHLLLRLSNFLFHKVPFSDWPWYLLNFFSSSSCNDMGDPVLPSPPGGRRFPFSPAKLDLDPREFAKPLDESDGDAETAGELPLPKLRQRVNITLR